MKYIKSFEKTYTIGDIHDMIDSISNIFFDNCDELLDFDIFEYTGKLYFDELKTKEYSYIANFYFDTITQKIKNKIEELKIFIETDMINFKADNYGEEYILKMYFTNDQIKEINKKIEIYNKIKKYNL